MTAVSSFKPTFWKLCKSAKAFPRKYPRYQVLILDMKSELIPKTLLVSKTINVQRHGLWLLTNSNKGNKPSKEMPDFRNKHFWAVPGLKGSSRVSHEIVIHQLQLWICPCFIRDRVNFHLSSWYSAVFWI